MRNYFVLLTVNIAVFAGLFTADVSAFTARFRINYRQSYCGGVGKRCDHRNIGRGNIRIVILPASPSESDSVKNLLEENEAPQPKNEVDLDILNEIESGEPFDWRQMQQALGINIFTIILAAMIVFFLSMNATLGPGWLGAKVGIPGTGTIQEVSPSLPGAIDLNRPEYRL